MSDPDEADKAEPADAFHADEPLLNDQPAEGARGVDDLIERSAQGVDGEIEVESVDLAAIDPDTGRAADLGAPADRGAADETAQPDGPRDHFARLAIRLDPAPSGVEPVLGLRFAPTPDLPAARTVEWNRRWRSEQE